MVIINKIFYDNCIKEKNVKIYYVFKTKKDQNGNIVMLKCAKLAGNGKFELLWINTEELSKLIYTDEVCAWRGEVDNENKCFKNVSKIIPEIIDGKYYLSTTADDSKKNNLETLPCD